jgi:hypothetical protein
MHEIKELFDPARRPNPGVILNDDPQVRPNKFNLCSF